MFRKTIDAIVKTTVAICMLTVATAHAAVGDPVVLLGVETTLSDRTTWGGKLLNDRITSDVAKCTNAYEDNAVRFDKCVETKVYFYRLFGFITPSEQNILNAAIVTARDNYVPPTPPTLNPITLLDVPTSVIDRETRGGKLLSERIEADVAYCDSRYSTLPSRYYRCVKLKVFGYKLRRYITTDERNALYAAIELAEEGGVEPPAPVYATFEVRVIQPDGSAISVVDVSDANGGASFGSTNDQGRLTISTIEAGSSSVLKLTSPDFGTQVVPVKTVAGEQTVAVDVVMMPVEEVALTVSGNVMTATTADGVSAVSFPVGAFVDASGAVADESNIKVTMTHVDVADPAEIDAFPGSFTGIDAGVVETIASLGTVEFTFTTKDTETPLQLASGFPAMIRMPISFDTRPDTGEAIAVGDSIPIWSLNEDTGVWLREGSGSVIAIDGSPTGYALTAQVSHFSWWNIDVSVDTGEMNVRVNSPEDGVANVTGVPRNIAWRNGTSTQNVGEVAVSPATPANSEICYSATVNYGPGQFGTTDTVCKTVQSGGSESVELEALGLDDPLSLGANVALDEAGDRRVLGFENRPTQRVSVTPQSIESDVTYTVTGLPAGMRTEKPIPNTVLLVGVPTESGVFNVTISGENADGEADSVTVIYDIDSESVAPPEEINAVILGNFEQTAIYLNDYVAQAPDEWEIISGGALPTGMTFDGTTGEFRIPSSRLFNTDPDFWSWSGVVRAFFNGGSTTVDYPVTVTVDCSSCSGPSELL